VIDIRAMPIHGSAPGTWHESRLIGKLEPAFISDELGLPGIAQSLSDNLAAAERANRLFIWKSNFVFHGFSLVNHSQASAPDRMAASAQIPAMIQSAGVIAPHLAGMKIFLFPLE